MKMHQMSKREVSFAQVKPTLAGLRVAQVRRRTLRDVLEGDARDCVQPNLIMTVGTSAGSSDSYVRTGDDGDRALHCPTLDGTAYTPSRKPPFS